MSSESYESSKAGVIDSCEDNYIDTELVSESYKHFVGSQSLILDYSTSGKVVQTLAEFLEIFSCKVISEVEEQLQILHLATGAIIRVAKLLFSENSNVDNNTSG